LIDFPRPKNTAKCENIYGPYAKDLGENSQDGGKEVISKKKLRTIENLR